MLGRVERPRRGDLLRAAKDDDRRVLLEQARAGSLAADGARLARDLEVGWRLRDRSVVLAPQALESIDGVPTLVRDDFEGCCLRSLLRGPLDLRTFLERATTISRAVDELHQANVAHCDLEPETILVAPSGRVKLIELGRALVDGAEGASAALPLDGSAAYMSPEQTGRTNRTIDARTDLYSLGVMFYEMLTGRLPFDADNALEWVHAHLARPPHDPSTIVEGLPRVLADIVLKLLSKAAEDRYQTAAGIVADLERCAEELASTGKIASFPLGTSDVSDRLIVPQRLFGREAELSSLLGVFENVASAGRSALVLISGDAGLGKTSLIAELQRPVLERRGYFATGKFEQHKADIPFSTLATALQALVREVSNESDERLAEYRRDLASAVGDSGRIVVDLVPPLGALLPPQSPTADLSPLEAQHRFRTVFRRLLGVFAREAHPLVLFLDDLQWADVGSLSLLKELAAHTEEAFLLVIGAYRENEITPEHPLRRVLDEAGRAGARISRVSLRSLSEEDLRALVSATLRADPAAVAPLAQLLFEKTAGNPFFARQFLNAIYDERLIWFDRALRAWRWDVARIRAKGFTDNLVELMIGRLERLSSATRRALERMACLGSIANVEAIARTCGCAEDRVRVDLGPATSAGLVISQGDTYKFLHDRVREAAYSLLTRDERARLHLQIGRAIAASTPLTDEMLFDAVNQLNRGAERMTDPSERARAAELNLRAGRRAKATTAYGSAAAYFAAGCDLLGEEGWAGHHELEFALHMGAAEAAHAVFDFVASARICDVVAARARTPLEEARACNLRIDLYTAQGDFPKALASGLQTARLLGVDLSTASTPDDVRREEDRVWELLGDRPVEALAELPPMTNPEMLLAMDALAAIHPASYFLGEWALYQTIPSCMTRISLQHGNAPASSMAYGQFASFLVYARARYSEALRFATVGCAIADTPTGIASRPKAYFAMGANVCPYTRPMSTVLQVLDRSVDVARQAGDPTFVLFTLINRAYDTLLYGRSLEEAAQYSARTVEFMKASGIDALAPLVRSTERLVFALQGRTARVASLGDDAEFRESEIDEALRGPRVPGIVLCWFHAARLVARYYGGEYRAALESARELDGRESVIASNPVRLDYELYTPLALTALQRSEEVPDFRARVLRHLHQLELYAKSCPETFEHRHALVAAEVAAIEGRELEAQRLYQAAIRSANDNGFVLTEGLAYELAAGFYRARRYMEIADTYLSRARACFARAGAHGLVKQLDASFPHLKRPLGDAAQVDVLAVVKASQAISGKLVLDELLDTLMRTVVENAGAQNGWLCLLRGDEVAVAAEARLEQERVVVRIHRSAAALRSRVPESILNYVRRSGERVLLSNAAKQSTFSRDPYFLREEPKSVLCIPILRKGAVLALLYLENNFVTDAFTVDRLAVLEILASQAAISVESSLLYETLAEENRERKRAELALRESQDLLQVIIDNSTTLVFAKDLEGRYILVNRRVYEVFDPKGGSLIGKTLLDLLPNKGASELLARDRRVIEAGKALETEETFPTSSGPRTYLVRRFPLRDASGEIFALCGMGTDITERKRLEAQFLQAQKMESVGRLAAGVAHDFNNLLTVILGYVEVLRTSIDSREALEDLEEVGLAAGRAAKLTRQLLTFARRNVAELDVLDLSQVVDEICSLVRRLIGEDVELIVRSAKDIWSVRADAGQIEQVLVNLAVNARDAMPSGGRLSIELANIDTSESTEPRQEALAPGQYVRLSIGDTGTGMTEETRAHVFEPFFTTKEKGKGTGLGLATCYGIVQQCGGHISCESELGRGTTFRIDLPRVRSAATTRERPRESTAPRGSGTILLVEDDAAVRTVAVRSLRALGYRILEAANGKIALKIAEAEPTIDLLVTDLVMPEMGGREVALRIRELRPTVRVLFVSGYTDDVFLQQGRLAAGEAFLQKPFSPSVLAQRVRSVLADHA